MKVEPTRLPDVVVIEPRVFEDERGWFMETWNRRAFAAASIDVDFVQDNHSSSVRGTLRGLHYQLRRPQGKLVRATRGQVFDVAVDLRRTSETFGRWVGVVLTADDRKMLWIPPGFAHGFYAQSEVADIQYKCTESYAPEDERCLRWDDPLVAVDWPFADGAELLLSARDRAGALLEHADVYD